MCYYFSSHVGLAVLHFYSEFNPLVHDGRNIYSIAHISFVKKNGSRKEIPYERRVYESVDEKSLS